MEATLAGEKIAILGASRGLGASLVHRISEQGPCDLFLASRKIDKIESLLEPLRDRFSSVSCQAADFSKEPDQVEVIAGLNEFAPSRVFYVAGGGPHGVFGEKEWKDHIWAFQVSFLFAARVLHAFAGQPFLKQIVFVGSAVAENAADPLAASYAASKHALHGLIRTVTQENSGVDIRLFSPGYMATDMLPRNIDLVRKGHAMSVEKASTGLLEWALRPSDGWHQMF